MLQSNQVAVSSMGDLLYKDIANKDWALVWHRKDHVVILTRTGANMNSFGKIVGDPWYSASRATFKQRILARLNNWDWFPWEFEL